MDSYPKKAMTILSTWYGDTRRNISRSKIKRRVLHGKCWMTPHPDVIDSVHKGGG